MARRHGWELPFHTFQVHSHSHTLTPHHTIFSMTSSHSFLLSFLFVFSRFLMGLSFNFPPIFHLLLPLSLSRLPLSSFDSFPFYPTQPHLFFLCFFFLFFAVNSCSSFMRNLMRFVVYIVSAPFLSHFLEDSVFSLE